MRFRSKALFGLIALAALVVGPAVPVFAAETAASEFVIVRPENIVEGDLYAVGVKVSIEGTVEGDLLAFAAEEIVISGTVTGSVIAIAPAVTVSGSVNGSVRATGRTFTLTGNVDEDVVLAVFNATLASPSTVGGEVLAWTGSMTALGDIGIDLTGSVGRLDLAGSIGRDLDVSLARLTITDSLTVAGDLGYRSQSEATGLDRAVVDGAIVKKSPLPQNIRVRALGFLGRFLLVIFLTVSAIGVAYSWPDRTKSAVAKVGSEPWKSWALGFSVFLFPLLLFALGALLVGVAPAAAAFPLLVVMIPLVMATSGVVLLLSLAAGVPAVTWLGGRLFPKFSFNGAVAAGSAVAAVAWFIPVVGWLVPVLGLPLGMGAWIRSLRN